MGMGMGGGGEGEDVDGASSYLCRVLSWDVCVSFMVCEVGWPAGVRASHIPVLTHTCVCIHTKHFPPKNTAAEEERELRRLTGVPHPNDTLLFAVRWYQRMVHIHICICV